MNKKLLLIVNPRSGKTKKAGAFEKIQKNLADAGWQIDTVFTEYSEHAKLLAADAKDYDRVVCVGGDGTLNEVINGLMKLEKRPQLGYVPTGSTNDFACGIGLPRSISGSSSLAGVYSICPIDIGSFCADDGENKFFSYVASFGLFTKLSYSTDQTIKNKFGHMAYIFEGIRSISELNKFKPFKMRIETFNSVIEQEYIFGAVTNSTSLGGLVKLDKENVKVNDGVFELLLIRKPKNLLDLTDTVSQLVNHKYRADRIIFSHTDSVTLTSETPLDWTLDGEYAGCVSKVDVKVLPSAIDFVRREEVRKKALFKKQP